MSYFRLSKTNSKISKSAYDTITTYMLYLFILKTNLPSEK